MIQILYLYILGIVVFETSAMTCFKKSLHDPRFFALGVLFYGCVGFLLCQTYTFKGLAITNALWSALSVASTTIVGVLLYKEVLHYHDYIAIALLVTGVMILRSTD
jgi:multidrug transporter EmrE-like cation transporter